MNTQTRPFTRPPLPAPPPPPLANRPPAPPARRVLGSPSSAPPASDAPRGLALGAFAALPWPFDQLLPAPRLPREDSAPVVSVEAMPALARYLDEAAEMFESWAAQAASGYESIALRAAGLQVGAAAKVLRLIAGARGD